MAITKEQTKTRPSLSNYEQETIINFNKGEDTAYIFTYEKTWQRHLEKKLGLKPLYDNGHGGREYELPRSRIKPPRAKIKLSNKRKKELANRMAEIRPRIIPRNAISAPKT